MCRVCVSCSEPIRFTRFEGKFVNRGLQVLDQARALDPCHRTERSWALGIRMKVHIIHIDRAKQYIKKKHDYMEHKKVNTADEFSLVHD